MVAAVSIRSDASVGPALTRLSLFCYASATVPPLRSNSFDLRWFGFGRIEFRCIVCSVRRMTNTRVWFVRINDQPIVRSSQIVAWSRRRRGRLAASLARAGVVAVGVLIVMLAGLGQIGCRRSVPIHVWLPPQAPVPSSAARVAIAPIFGNPDLAAALHQALMAERPTIRADLAIVTPEQLRQQSTVQLASTAPLTSDVLSVAAAREAGADILLQGVVLDADIDVQSLLAEKKAQQPEKVDWNQAYFHKPPEGPDKHERIVLSWRAIDVASGQTIGSHSFNLATQQAIERYPDLDFVQHDQTQLLISASARESWKTIAPFVDKDHVRLAVPWLQPGSFTVRRGVRAARKGDWQLAEQHWQRAANRLWSHPAAHHNLALALAAREDYPAAKAELQKATGPLSLRLPPETLVWLDQQHRHHNAALGLGTPAEGWSFPEPNPRAAEDAASRSIIVADVATLPWWTAIPFAKPPGWSWQGWLSQPWAL